MGGLCFINLGVTFVQSVLGKKKWIPAFFRNTNISHTKFTELLLLRTNLLANQTEIEANWYMEVVTLQEGDLFIQPPGQYHAAYTPTESFVKGAHCLNLEFCITASYRYIDTKKGYFLTNQVHEHSLETLEQMVIYLPHTSCCTNSHKYVAVGTNKKKTLRNITKPTLTISRVVIKYFWKDVETVILVYVWLG
ncbi:hypothetical protein C8R48DRAFT_677793 [Suillus tomentosus]|nr:hypothetical protein C8R48DRAFT_677793 [Suillus tomentosus]